jgi:FMN phosphatase YigB (HAD superfamily)
VTLPYGSETLDAVLFDLDDVLVPFDTPQSWQWAWHPQGPVLCDRRVRAAVRRSLRAWDRRRWQGLTGKQPPADLAALRQHISDTLAAVAGHTLPAPETEAVVRRMLRPAGEVERFPDVAPLLARLSAAGVKVGVATPLPAESAQWVLHRTGLPASLLILSGDPPGPILPERAAFRGAAERLGAEPRHTGYVGDLFWSDVRAAARAGLRAILLDRHDAWPKVQVGRITSLDGLEAAFAKGDAPPPDTDEDGPDGVAEASQ